MYCVVSVNFTTSESRMADEQVLHRKNALVYTPPQKKITDVDMVVGGIYYNLFEYWALSEVPVIGNS